MKEAAARAEVAAKLNATLEERIEQMRRQLRTKESEV